MIGTGFFSAPKNIYKVHLFFEMLTARNFEYDNIFIQYHVELPEFWKCEDEKMLTGSTQTSKMKGVEKVANFGHTFDVSFEFNTKEVGKNGKIYIFLNISLRSYFRGILTMKKDVKNLIVFNFYLTHFSVSFII